MFENICIINIKSIFTDCKTFYNYFIIFIFLDNMLLSLSYLLNNTETDKNKNKEQTNEIKNNKIKDIQYTNNI